MHEVSLLDREIQIHRKSNNEQQEKNEKLNLELHMAQNECENLEKKIDRRKVEAEVLLAEYSSYRRALKEAEITLRSLKKVVRTLLLQPLYVCSSIKYTANSPNLSFIIPGSQRCPACI